LGSLGSRVRRSQYFAVVGSQVSLDRYAALLWKRWAKSSGEIWPTFLISSWKAAVKPKSCFDPAASFSSFLGATSALWQTVRRQALASKIVRDMRLMTSLLGRDGILGSLYT